MKRISVLVNTLVAVALCALAPSVLAADGLTAVKSPHNSKETMEKLESVVKQRGLNVFARIDHAGGVLKIGKILRPTELLI